jgi:phage baseplate assembly protein gpV
MREYVGRGNFTWFFGVVEDRNDPVQLGRVRVRAYGYHSDNKDQIPTDQLPWAVPLNGVDSAAISGVGISPTGMVEGSWVVGFFMDGDRAQEPAILGTLSGVPSQLADTSLGFNDPKGIYPKYIDKSDVNELARGDYVPPVENAGKIGAPNTPYAAQYPYNHVRATESGHYTEFDDTPNAERIKEFHKSGTLYEVHPTGDKVTRVVKDNYSLVAGDDKLHVKGNVTIFVDGDTNLTVAGTTTVDTPLTNWTGNINLTGDLDITGKSTASVDHVSSGISGKGHTHKDTPGLGAGDTSKPQ